MVPNNALTLSSNCGAASHSHEGRNGQVKVLFLFNQLHIGFCCCLLDAYLTRIYL